MAIFIAWQNCHANHFANSWYSEAMAKLALEKLLEKKSLSKRQFAKLLQMDYPSVFRFFRPGYDPKLSTLEKWAKVLGVKIKELYEE
jgi:transcriptional regulator with XRE-family HTH domain